MNYHLHLQRSLLRSIQRIRYSFPQEAATLKVCLKRSVREKKEREVVLKAEKLPKKPLCAREMARNCKMLLFEILQRTIQEWVVNKNAVTPIKKEKFKEAHIWLFLEDETHENWKVRKESGKQLTSFLGICEVLNLCPGIVRGYVLKATPSQVRKLSRKVTKSQTTAWADFDPQEFSEKFLNSL